jgi:hypothetical protein
MEVTLYRYALLGESAHYPGSYIANLNDYSVFHIHVHK